VWNLEGDSIMVLPGHTSEVYALLEWNSRLYSAGFDKVIKVWDQKGNRLTIKGELVADLSGTVRDITQMEVWQGLLLASRPETCLE
jgi:WD40 repeat protein